MRPASSSRRRKRRGEEAATALFPFLAVLVCTMGSLILLLVVIARQARIEAERAAAATEAGEVPDIDFELELDLVEWRIDELKRSREKTERELAEARLRLGHIEDHTRRLVGDLERLQAMAAALDRDDESEGRSREVLRADLDRLASDLAEAERGLEAAERAAGNRKPSYAVIPYEGQHGTRRRPIYIECRGDAVVIQPDGIPLAASDFLGPLGPGNPLAAAIRAAREHMLVNGGLAEDEEPYPLLLVRPDGIVAYYAARAAMDSWSSEYGYELIDSEMEIAYPPIHKQRPEVVEQAVLAARQRQRLLASAAPRGYAGGGQRREFRAAPGGGLVPIGGSGTPGRSRGSFSSRAAPARDHPESNPYADLLANVDRGGTTAGDAGNEAAAGLGDGGAGAGAPPGGGESASPWQTAPRSPAFASPVGPHGRDALSGGPVPSRAGGSPSDGNSDPAPPSAMAIPNSEGPENGPPAPGRDVPHGSDVDFPAVGEGERLADSPMPQGIQRHSASPHEESSDAAEASGVPAATAAGIERPPTAGAQGSGPSQPSHAPGGGAGASRPMERHSLNVDLPEPPVGAVGITRPIRVECYEDRLVLPRQGTRLDAVVIPFGASTADAIEPLLTALAADYETWGDAGRGMYWQPVVEVWVDPQARGRFAELKAAVDRLEQR